MVDSFTITQAALDRVRIILSQEQAGLFFRISVSGGGCSGFQYHFTFDDTKTSDDLVFGTEDSPVIIDTFSLDLIKGGILDYTSDLTASTFVIRNPNAKSGCGCGNSFSL